MKRFLGFLVCAACTLPALAGERVLHRFAGGNDGCLPKAGLTAGSGGSLYGTTYQCGGGASEGTVFQLSPPSAPAGAWSETILHSFLTIGSGQYPWAGLTADSAGNLYGTTWLGGTNATGVVFELSPPVAGGTSWAYNVLYSFGSGTHPQSPEAGLVFDAAGNLYGTTSYGGLGSCINSGEPPYPCGAVFRLSPPSTPGAEWSFKTLYSFTGDEDGTGAGVTVGPDGVIYGTTESGGSGHCGPQRAQRCGTVFQLTPPATPGGGWAHTVIYSFQGTDGAVPAASVILDGQGNLYGTTQFGGAGDCDGEGCGTVFELSPPPTPGGAWTETALHLFGTAPDGSEPWSSLVMDAKGNLYGTTAIGPGTGCFGGGCGIAFQLTPPSVAGSAWTETILHTFTGGRDGGLPFNLVFGQNGALYGTTNVGGGSTLCGPQHTGCGTVFEVSR